MQLQAFSPFSFSVQFDGGVLAVRPVPEVNLAVPRVERACGKQAWEKAGQKAWRGAGTGKKGGGMRHSSVAHLLDKQAAEKTPKQRHEPWSDDSLHMLNRTFRRTLLPPPMPSSKLIPARGPL